MWGSFDVTIHAHFIIVIYNVIMTNMSVIILYIVNPAYMHICTCEIMLFTLYYAKCGVCID